MTIANSPPNLSLPDHKQLPESDGTFVKNFQQHPQSLLLTSSIRIPFYAIYEVKKAAVEVYELVGNRYQQMQPNDRGHYPIPLIGVELGIWQGEFIDQNLPWLRWWDAEGNLLLDGDERAKQEAQRADRLAAKLRELGIDPEAV